jgi:hypothetical protein
MLQQLRQLPKNEARNTQTSNDKDKNKIIQTYYRNVIGEKYTISLPNSTQT